MLHKGESSPLLRGTALQLAYLSLSNTTKEPFQCADKSSFISKGECLNAQVLG